MNGKLFYKSIKDPAEGIFKDKGSKFMAYAYPVLSEDEIKAHLIQIKKSHPSARHHCYAWRLGTENPAYRANDDGEPSGSAGKPILNTLLSKELTNTVVFVVRYFGGTLLGVPGLINAYKLATVDALDNAIIIQKPISYLYDIAFDYLHTNEVMRIVKEYKIKVISQAFDNNCCIRLDIEKEVLAIALEKIKKITPYCKEVS